MQYALSRRQIGLIQDVLPKMYFDPIKEFHITSSSPGVETFEYIKDKSEAHFCYPVEQKNADIIEDAVIELLIGLKRIKTKTKWGYPIKDNERIELLEFSDEWLKKCMDKLGQPKS